MRHASSRCVIHVLTDSMHVHEQHGLWCGAFALGSGHVLPLCLRVRMAGLWQRVRVLHLQNVELRCRLGIYAYAGVW